MSAATALFKTGDLADCAGAILIVRIVRSRCTFRCVRCERTGSRSETFRPRQPTIADSSHFLDRCPNCGSHDVEVIAPPCRIGPGNNRG